MLFDDTDPAVERELLERLCAAPPWRKLRMTSQLSLAMRQLYMSGLRRRHPKLTGRERERMRLVAWYGSEVAALVPDDEGAGRS